MQEKQIYRYEAPFGGKRTHIGGGWLPAREEIVKYEKLHPATYEILAHRLYSICNDARQAILRVSGSPVVAEGGEALFAIYDPHGFTSSLACGLLLHAVGTQGNIREVMEVQHEAPGIHDGDIFMMNEPSIGGYHACDQWTGTPLFYEGELVAWLGSLTHTAETGAIEPGGIPASARSLLHEGYRVQGIKVQERGKLNMAAVNCLLRSTRDPAYYVLDLRARIAGLNVAKVRFLELIQRYGIQTVKAAIQQNLDHAEEMARAKLRSLADGTWRFVAYRDWDVGPEPKLIKILTTMTKEGDTLTLDFEATSPNEGNLNCHPPGSFGLVFVALASQLFWETPGNYGFLRPLKVYFPANTCLSIPYMTPCGLCAGLPVTESVAGTVAKMLYTNPKLWGDINAPWAGPAITAIAWGGLTQHGYPSGAVFSESWGKGTGAGIDEGRGDGCDSGGLMMTVESCISDIEMMELMSPFMYLWRREGMDTAGAGRWRGGATVQYAVTPHNSPYVLLSFVAHGAYADDSQSIDGAYPPALETPCYLYKGTNLQEAYRRRWIPQSVDDLDRIINEDGGVREIVKSPLPAQPVKVDSDVAVSVQAGGKGIGDPLDREPARVLADVRGKVTSLEMAKMVYGVIIDAETMAVDTEATDAAREDIKAKRRQRGKVWEGK